MSDKIIENNQVTIMGQVASTFEFSHEVFGEGFYTMEVLVKRPVSYTHLDVYKRQPKFWQ